MSFESVVTFFIAIFVFAITPGPGTFAILARSLSSGASACFTLALGMSLSDIVYLVMACYGLAAVAENWGQLFTAIRFVGAGYLLYLGWRMWVKPMDGHLENADGIGRTGGKGLVQGFLISGSNPKVILFYIAFLPTFMDLNTLTQSGILLAAGLTLTALMLGLMLVAVCASSIRFYFRSPQALRRLNRSAGFIMMGVGSFLALSR